MIEKEESMATNIKDQIRSLKQELDFSQHQVEILQNLAKQKCREVQILREKITEQREIMNEMQQVIYDLEAENYGLRQHVESLLVYDKNEENDFTKDEETKQSY